MTLCMGEGIDSDSSQSSRGQLLGVGAWIGWVGIG
jgi:hypothetical protein